MSTSPRVEEILSWYDTDDVATRSCLRRLLEHGRTAHSGKLVVLPVDQGFEHGPARSFAVNRAGYDPRYHARLAIDAGCSAHAAPLGAIQRIAKDFAEELPLILKCNSSDSLYTGPDPLPALTASVDDAVRLGCVAVGFTIYPGSAGRNVMYEQLRRLVAQARDAGLPVVVWSYPRGSGISKEGQTAVDVVAYAAHLACQLGAHIVKVKPPTAHLEMPAAAAALRESGTRLDTLADRVRHVVESAFDGHRIVIFSGGPAKDTLAVLEENRQTALGGGFGTIMGRNAFQRPRTDALRLLAEVMDIHRESRAHAVSGAR
ncbi:class I fructose-bisphosphate aldolase [Myceligenerans indicum]|uniref:fructose-bisphosphate aldolase n=1 Tax=Myceligenerans indicum TaxID=2593663 RepID=A0ABS1LJE7_9MICO|nr:class I fructose-bisphosphate aldolase [Myceligenerans indicum]MBL0886279.1 class I fructose-bisphosphate aldolase [Myceligenerans indicum]